MQAGLAAGIRLKKSDEGFLEVADEVLCIRWEILLQLFKGTTGRKEGNMGLYVFRNH